MSSLRGVFNPVPQPQSPSGPSIVLKSYLPPSLTFSFTKRVLMRDVPQDLFDMRATIIRWEVYQLCFMTGAIGLFGARRSSARVFAAINVLVMMLTCMGLYGSLRFSPLLISLHTVTVSGLVFFWAIYFIALGATETEAHYFLIIYYLFIAFDAFISFMSIKFLLKILAFEKHVDANPQLLVPPASSPPPPHDAAGCGAGQHQRSNHRDDSSAAGGGRGGAAIYSSSSSAAHVAVSSSGQHGDHAAELRRKISEINDFSDCPNQFLCPIGMEVMVDPVVAFDSITYERENIVKWFKEHDKSPVTGVHLSSRGVIGNTNLKTQIEEYLDRKIKESQRRKNEREVV